MIELFWRVVALFVSLPRAADWLIEQAKRTPYSPIMSSDGTDLYMGRWWLFNPYPLGTDGVGRRWGDWLPSVRVHWIRREDRDRHMHDHPWNARTIILRGYYVEQRMGQELEVRRPGTTARLLFGEFHRILTVPEDGVWTLFITWRKRGAWGFWVDGEKVPWRQYLILHGMRPADDRLSLEEFREAFEYGAATALALLAVRLQTSAEGALDRLEQGKVTVGDLRSALAVQ